MSKQTSDNTSRPMAAQKIIGYAHLGVGPNLQVIFQTPTDSILRRITPRCTVLEGDCFEETLWEGHEGSALLPPKCDTLLICQRPDNILVRISGSQIGVDEGKSLFHLRECKERKWPNLCRPHAELARNDSSEEMPAAAAKAPAAQPQQQQPKNVTAPLSSSSPAPARASSSSAAPATSPSAAPPQVSPAPPEASSTPAQVPTSSSPRPPQKSASSSSSPATRASSAAQPRVSSPSVPSAPPQAKVPSPAQASSSSGPPPKAASSSPPAPAPASSSAQPQASSPSASPAPPQAKVSSPPAPGQASPSSGPAQKPASSSSPPLPQDSAAPAPAPASSSSAPPPASASAGPSPPSPPTRPPCVLVPPNATRWGFFPLCMKTGPGSTRKTPYDGDCGYWPLVWRKKKNQPIEIRELYDDFVDDELLELWPDVRDSVIKAVKERIWLKGVRGRVGKKPRVQDIWLDSLDLNWLAHKLRLIIVTYDSRDPAKMATYVPLFGEVDWEPLLLQCSMYAGHWQEVPYLEGAPLPPICLGMWGKEQKERFFASELHAELHRRFQFWAFRRDPERAGCGCQGNAP